MTAAGYQIWWKKYLTSLQITQFVLDMGFVYFATLTWHADRGFLPDMFNFGSCYGTTQAAYFGCVLLTSYLYLFIEFFAKTYINPRAAPQKGAVTAKPAPAGKTKQH